MVFEIRAPNESSFTSGLKYYKNLFKKHYGVHQIVQTSLKSSEGKLESRDLSIIRIIKPVFSESILSVVIKGKTCHVRIKGKSCHWPTTIFRPRQERSISWNHTSDFPHTINLKTTTMLHLLTRPRQLCHFGSHIQCWQSTTCNCQHFLWLIPPKETLSDLLFYILERVGNFLQILYRFESCIAADISEGHCCELPSGFEKEKCLDTLSNLSNSTS